MSVQDRIGVFGLGNPWRRDDGVGIVLLEMVREHFESDARFDFFDFGISSFSLINYMGRFQRVLLIDAIDAGWQPGAMRIFRLQEAAIVAREEKLSTHELKLDDLLSLCQQMELTVDIRVAGVQVVTCEEGEGLSPILKGIVAVRAAEIQKFLETW